jgi:hypothetical protein
LSRPFDALRFLCVLLLGFVSGDGGVDDDAATTAEEATVFVSTGHAGDVVTDASSSPSLLRLVSIVR